MEDFAGQKQGGRGVEVRFVGCALDEESKDSVWRLLCACDNEFYPCLSARDRSDQKNLDLGAVPAGASATGPRKYFAQILLQEFILAYFGGEFAGFMTFRREEPAKALPELGSALYVTTVCVGRALRGRGVMNALYDSLEGEVASAHGMQVVYTRTWSLNAAQLHTLEKRGYARVAVLEDDRGKGVDTVYFAKRLGNLL